jgi:hypothetical protein
MLSRRSLLAITLVFGAAVSLPLPGIASQVPCKGERDNIDLGETALKVNPAERPLFLAEVESFASRHSLGVSRVQNLSRGTTTLILSRIPSDGVLIRLSDRKAPGSFRAWVRTCNATVDWRPVWHSFLAFLDEQRTAGLAN